MDNKFIWYFVVSDYKFNISVEKEDEEWFESYKCFAINTIIKWKTAK